MKQCTDSESLHGRLKNNRTGSGINDFTKAVERFANIG